MGLDMYLWGEKFYASSEAERPKEDGLPVVYKFVELGYWRKHPDLHGYIVETFADGRDDCQKIEIFGDEAFDQIINAVREGKLPHTEGFFFGASRNDADQNQRTIRLLEEAKAWANVKEPGVWRSVNYEASW